MKGAAYKMEEKLISVIVTAYNIEEYLPRCLDSILTQVYSNLQIIVIDDGSTDKTGTICDEYAAKDSRIQIIHQPNQGPSVARNAGLDIARGSYIGFVDGDDWIQPDMYKAMYNACRNEDAEMACCSYKKVGRVQEEQSFSAKQYLLTREEALDIYICDNAPFHIYHSVWSKLFRRDIIESLKFPLGRKSEDIMYTTRALAQVVKCVFLDLPYYNYVVDREDSIMNSDIIDRRFKDEIPFWKEQTGYLYGLGMQELARKASYQYYRKMLFYYIDFRKRKLKPSAEKLVQILRNEKREINNIYKMKFVKTGDRIRMKVFLRCPGAYYRIVKLYDSLVVPLRQKH